MRPSRSARCTPHIVVDKRARVMRTIRRPLRARPCAEGQMKKTLLRIGSACGLALLFFGSSSAHAFCTQCDGAGVGVNCVDEGHKKVTGYLEPFMRPEIWSDVWNGNYAQDNPFGDFADDGQRHFQSCLFRNKPYFVANIPYIDPGSIEYIRDTYRNSIAYLNPVDPDPVTAADR